MLNYRPQVQTTSEAPVHHLPYRSIFTRFLDRVAAHPSKPVFELADGSIITYGDLLKTTQQIAAALHTAGVSRGDRVAAQVEKSPQAIAAYLAVLQLGALYLPLNTAYTDAELRYFIDDAKPTVMLVDPSREADINALAPGLIVRTLDRHGRGSLTETSARRTAVEPIHGCDEAAILYTSGTTGRSKGAVLTQENLASNCVALLEAWEFTGQDRLIHALPIFHIHGLFVAANMTLVAGATMLWMETFDAEEVIELFPKATVLMGVPTFYTRLLASEHLTAGATSTMRLFVSGSAPLLAADHAAFTERTGHQILERYGMTETGMNTTNPYEGERRAGSVGFPLSDIEVIVANRGTGEQLPTGDIGSIEVRGPNVFDRYWNNPEKTQEEKRETGFFITGDQGYYDTDGYLHISGRTKDLIISGGYNVYPKEVEQLLDAHSSVKESAVIGVPHADLGEAVVAVIVLKNGHQLDAGELRASIADDLARFKQPKAYRAVDQLPRNVMGKIQKAQLRERFSDVFEK